MEISCKVAISVVNETIYPRVLLDDKQSASGRRLFFRFSSKPVACASPPNIVCMAQNYFNRSIVQAECIKSDLCGPR